MDNFETDLAEALRWEARNAPLFDATGLPSTVLTPSQPRRWPVICAATAVAATVLLVPLALSFNESTDMDGSGGFADGTSSSLPSQTPTGNTTRAPLDQRVNETVEHLAESRSLPAFGALLITDDLITVLWEGPAPASLRDIAGRQPNGTTIRVVTSTLTSDKISDAEHAIAELASRHDVAVLSYGPAPERNALVVEIDGVATPRGSDAARAFEEAVAQLSAPVRLVYLEGAFTDR